MSLATQPKRRTVYECRLVIPEGVWMTDARKTIETGGTVLSVDYQNRAIKFDIRCFYPTTVAETIGEIYDSLGGGAWFDEATVRSVKDAEPFGNVVDIAGDYDDGEWEETRTFDELYGRGFTSLAVSRFRDYHDGYTHAQVLAALREVERRWGADCVTIDNVLAELEWDDAADDVVDGILDSVGESPADINGYVDTAPFEGGDQ